MRTCVSFIYLHLVSEHRGYKFSLYRMETSKAKESSFSLSYPSLTKTSYTILSLKIKVFRQAHGVSEDIEPKDLKIAIDDKLDKWALAVIYQGSKRFCYYPSQRRRPLEMLGTQSKLCCREQKECKRPKHILSNVSSKPYR